MYVVLTALMEWGAVPAIAAGGWLYYSVTALSLHYISKMRHYWFYTRAALLLYLTEGIVEYTRDDDDKQAQNPAAYYTKEAKKDHMKAVPKIEHSDDDVIFMKDMKDLQGEPEKLGMRKRMTNSIKNVFRSTKQQADDDNSPGTASTATGASSPPAHLGAKHKNKAH